MTDTPDALFGPINERVMEIKRLYPDLAKITIDVLFLTFLSDLAHFGLFSFGPITIDVRLVGRAFEQTYPRRDPPFSEPRGFDEEGRRFYGALARELARSGTRSPDELHFLLAFMRTRSGLPARVFGELGVTPEQVEEYARGRVATAAAPVDAATPSPHERLYSPDEAARYLGVHVKTVRAWTRSGKLPASRILGQRALRIRESDLTRVLEPLEPADDESS